MRIMWKRNYWSHKIYRLREAFIW